VAGLNKRKKEELRSQAEKRLAQQRKEVKDLSSQDITRLIHELKIRQIELEIQNEDLRQAQADLIQIRDNYQELFNSVPVGYFVLSEKNIILDVNQTAARMLATAKEKLRQKKFAAFIAESSQPTYYAEVNKVFEEGRQRELDLEMTGAGSSHFLAHLYILPVKDDTGQLSQIRIAFTDITEHRQTEETLKNSESVLQSFFESPGVMRGIVEILDDTTVRHILDNQEASRFFGLPHEKLRNILSSELGEPPEVIRGWIEAAKQSQQTRKSVTYEYIDMRKGRKIWLRDNVTYIGTTPEGKLRFIYVISDITARKEAEQKLAALAERQQQLLNLSKVIVGERDLDQLLIKVEKAAQVLTGSRIAVCGHGYVNGTFTVGGAYGPEGESPCPPAKDFHISKGGVYMELVEGKDSIRLTREQLLKHPAWWGLPEKHAPLNGLLGARLTDWNDQTNGIIMVSDKAAGEFTEDDEYFLKQLASITSLAIQHIEALQEVKQKAAELEARVQARTADLQQANEMIRQSQSQFQGLFENMGEGMILFDLQGKVLKINKAAGDILGIDPAVVEGTFYDSPYWKGKVTFPEGMTLSRENLGQFLQTSLQQVRRNLEVHVLLANGSSHWIRGSMAPLVNESSQLEGIIITFADITIEKELQKEQERFSLRLLQVQEEERKRIAYELHDDTAQYLSILKMQLGALIDSREIQSPKIKEKLQFLERDADRAFNDVRRYSHELRPVVLERSGLQVALEQLSDDYNKLSQLQITIEVGGEEPELTEEVKLGFFRIAQEALNNIRKHAKASKANIVLTFRDDRMEMIVTDNGTGFDVNEAAARAGGRGSLGLMSMRERARLIGANLKIDSKPGYGTVVRVQVLPDRKK
jgi:PAS domain S-box-containing protein